MAGEIYKKPIMFSIVAVVVILVGTVVTMFAPMMTEQMHPKLEGLKPLTALQLAGRDIYQREGCNNCHTQTVRPLKTEVLRYGEYSKAGEFAYDRPFLWGSKRTGPDLARIGGKYPDAWHYRHFDDPRKFFDKSNMPSYGWLKDRGLDPDDIGTHMEVMGFAYDDEEMNALAQKNELDALVAYVQVIGSAVRKTAVRQVVSAGGKPLVNPFAGDADAILKGKEIFEENCSACHGDNAEGDIGPSLIDNIFLYAEGDVADYDYFEIIHNGTFEGMIKEGRSAQGGMPDFGEELQKDEIWAVISFIRSLQNK